MGQAPKISLNNRTEQCNQVIMSLMTKKSQIGRFCHCGFITNKTLTKIYLNNNCYSNGALKL